MKKILGITFGGVQRKTLRLVLLVLLLACIMFIGVSLYQNRQLIRVVEGTRREQQASISSISSQTMRTVMDETLTATTQLQAQLAENDFLEVTRNLYTLQSMAESLLEKREDVLPDQVSPPLASMDGESAAYVLTEDGVDYTRSELLNVIAHLSSPMIAMHSNSEKIDSCYIGLRDGTFLCVDEKAGVKLDENGRPLSFPVRQRPWYIGAIEADGLSYTDMMVDAFSGRLLVTCSVPIRDGDEILGVVGLDIVLESMDDFVGGTTEGCYAYVVNDHGRVILGPAGGGILSQEIDSQSDLRENPALSELLVLAQTQNTGLQTVTLNGRAYYAVGAPMPSVGWSVLNIVDQQLTRQSELRMLGDYDSINREATSEFEAGVGRTRALGFALLAAVLVISLIAAYFSTKRMVKPIEQMTKSIQSSSVSGKLFEMKDEYKTNDEIELLAEAFAELSKKTKRYIKEITEITAEKERIGAELSLANRIQSAMLPHIFPAFPDRAEFDIYASMDPAKEVGGDFYDYFLVDDDHLCMVIADVSGKGVPAALFMMASKIILQSCAMLGKTPAEILTMTNQAICSNNQEEMFVTVWVGILELSTGKLTAANAGHEYPVLKLPDGSFQLYKDKHGFVIGGMDGMKYKEYALQLEPGAKLFLYTDGVPEATDANSVLFGTDRMLEALNTARDKTPEEILRTVRGAVDSFVQDAEQFDDLTMLCLEYKSPEAKP